MKVLIIRFSSIGDIVLTTPIIRCLKKQLQAENHFVTKKQFNTVIENNPFLDKIFLLNDDFPTLISNLKAENYDCIIDLHNNIRSRKIKQSLNIKSYTFDKLNFKKFLLVNFKINNLPNKHIVDRYFECIQSLQILNDDKGLDFYISEKNQVNTIQLFGNNYAVLVIGGQHFTKKMPNLKLIELCKSINTTIVIIGGKEDWKNGEEISIKTGAINTCGTYSIQESASIIKNSSHVYTHDTGMMHIASALQKTITSFWGNTIPAFGMYPYQVKKSIIIENKDLKCRPCSKIGYTDCPLSHFKCMNELKF